MRVLLAPNAAATLVIAHPAHELRVLDWLSRTGASVHILTTGSRASDDRTRLVASAQLLRDVGAHLADMDSATLDRDVYAAIFRGDAAPFFSWIDMLTSALILRRSRLVVTDSWQYYNVAHDLTHLMARLAAEQASRLLGWAIRIADYPVVSAALAPHAPRQASLATARLAPDRIAMKRALAHAYPQITGELEEALRYEGEDALAIERFNEPPPLSVLLTPPAHKPAYEVFGERRVASGLYADVLRWTHVENIARQLVMRRQSRADPAEAAAGRST